MVGEDKNDQFQFWEVFLSHYMDTIYDILMECLMKIQMKCSSKE